MKNKVILKSIALATLMLGINGCLGGSDKEDTKTKEETTTIQTNPTTQETTQTTEKTDTTKPTSETTNPTKTEVATTEDNVTAHIQEVDTTKEDNATTQIEEVNTTAEETTEETNTTTPTTETNTTEETNTTIPQTNYLTLSSPKTEILKDESITLSIKDKKGNDIKNNITWIVNPKYSIRSLRTNTITPKIDVPITIKAKYNNITSNPITLNVKWIVNGHTLPPKPDEKINNSTLLGIDSNNNDVRDDVERWIYETYKDKHPIHIDIAMQAGKAYRKVLQMPERAWEIHDEVNAPMECEAYYQIYAQYFNEPILVRENIDSKYFRNIIYFNTRNRRNIYRKYDSAFSGHTFALPKAKELKSKCDFNTSKYSK